MKIKLFTLIILLFSVANVSAEYKITKYTPITNYDSEFLELCLSSKSKSDYNFKQIFNLTYITGKNLSVRILGIPHETKLELYNYYKKMLSVELNEVLKSYGGIHNPKLGPLQNKFPSALKSTTLFLEINKILSTYDYKVVKIEFEKFSAIKNEIHVADIYIKCSKST